MSNLFGLFVAASRGDVANFVTNLESGVISGGWLNPLQSSEPSSDGSERSCSVGALLKQAERHHYPGLTCLIGACSQKTVLQLTKEAFNNFKPQELLWVTKMAIAGGHYSIDEFFVAFKKALPFSDLDLRDQSDPRHPTVLHLLSEYPEISYEQDRETRRDPIEMVLQRGASPIEYDALSRTPISIAASTTLSPNIAQSLKSSKSNKAEKATLSETAERKGDRRKIKMPKSTPGISTSRTVVLHFHSLARHWLRCTGDLFWRTNFTQISFQLLNRQSMFRLCTMMNEFKHEHHFCTGNKTTENDLLEFLEDNENGKKFMKRFHLLAIESVLRSTGLPVEFVAVVAPYLPYNNGWANHFAQLYNLDKRTLLPTNSANNQKDAVVSQVNTLNPDTMSGLNGVNGGGGGGGMGVGYRFFHFCDDLGGFCDFTKKWLVEFLSTPTANATLNISQQDWVQTLFIDWDALLRIKGLDNITSAVLR